MPTREQILAVVDDFFDGPATLDRLSLMSDDVEWWNGMGKFPVAPGQTVFRGKEEIGNVLLGRAPSPRQPNGRAIDRYDLSTKSFADVRTIVDGNHVFRQHTYRATTMRGRPYENVYGFLFRFDDDARIDRIWEHWGTLQAYETLFQGPLAEIDPDVILQTTPSVRKRLDLTRPVPREVIEECLDLALPHLDPPGERVTIPYEGKHLVGTLRKPRGARKPPVVIMTMLAMLYARFGDVEALRRILAGVSCAAVGLLLAVVFRMMSPLIKRRDGAGLIILLAVFVAIGLARLPLPAVLLVATPISIAVTVMIRRRMAA